MMPETITGIITALNTVNTIVGTVNTIASKVDTSSSHKSVEVVDERPIVVKQPNTAQVQSPPVSVNLTINVYGKDKDKPCIPEITKTDDGITLDID